MNAHIITIGDELLIGQVIDTNSTYISSLLTSVGIRVKRISTVSDTREDLLTVFSESDKNECQLTIITGGLGPTNDDITKKVLAEHLSVGMEFHNPTWQRIQDIMNRFGRTATEAQRNQSYLPQGCTVLTNEKGTAPGMWFVKDNGAIMVSLPGVPYEMKYLMANEVLPKLQAEFTLPAIVNKTIRTAGAGETTIAEKLALLEKELPKHIKLAYLPSLGQVRLRLSSEGADRQRLVDEIDGQAAKVNALIPKLVFGYDETTLVQAIGNILKDQNLSLALAESCTGGRIAAEIIAEPGASAFFGCGIVAYSYEMKTKLLDVSNDTLVKYGAVSEEVVLEMLQGVLTLSEASVGIAVSGVAGPGGGTPTKPVGTVSIAVGSTDKQIARTFNFGNDRKINISRTSSAALNMLRYFVLFGE